MDMASVSEKDLRLGILRRQKTGFSVPIQKWLVEKNLDNFKGCGLRMWAKTVFKKFGDYYE